MKNRLSSRHSSIAGFTLLEMLAVVAIIGILAALAAPGWLTFMSRQRAISAKDQVAQAIRATQNEAQRLRRSRGIKFVSAADSTTGVPEVIVGPLVDTGSDGTWDDVDGDPQTLGEGEFNPGTIDLTAFDNDGNPVDFLVFNADGSLSVDDTPAQPIKISVVAPPSGSGLKRCIVVETLLGAMRTEADGNCN